MMKRVICFLTLLLGLSLSTAYSITVVNQTGQTVSARVTCGVFWADENWNLAYNQSWADPRGCTKYIFAAAQVYVSQGANTKNWVRCGDRDTNYNDRDTVLVHDFKGTCTKNN